jgi:hypothetical protein
MSAIRGVSGRLWSLWDMQDLYLPILLELTKEIGRLNQMIAAEPPESVRAKQVKQSDIQIMNSHKETFEKLGLSMCRMHVERIISSCEQDDDLPSKTFSTMLEELYNRLCDECSLSHFVALSESDKKFYSPDSPLFGNEVENKLASVIEDISEAGKCLGLRRSTAAVFHLMRVMEIGVQRFGDKLGVPNTSEVVWQVILDQVNSAIKKMPKTQESKDYAEISAHLYNVKLAWRNETMHPKVTYTEEEAEGIFVAVRSFMKELVGVL